MLLVGTPRPEQEPSNYVLCGCAWKSVRNALAELELLGAQVYHEPLKSLQWVWLTELDFASAGVGRPDVQSQESDRLSSSLLQGIVLKTMCESSPSSLRQSSNMVTIFSFFLLVKKRKHKACTLLASGEKS